VAGKHVDTRGRSATKASSLLIANSLIASVVGFAFWTLLSRSLAPSEIGLLSTLTATAPVLATIATFGLSDTLMRFFAGHNKPNALWSWIVLTVLLSSTTIGAVWLGVQWYLSSINTNSIFSGTYAAAFEILIVSVALDALALTALIATKNSALVLAETLIIAPIKIFAALQFKDQNTIALVIALMALLGLCVSLIATHLAGLRFSKPISQRKLVGQFAVSNWVSTSFSLVPKAALTVLVGYYLGLSEVAWISVPMLILTAMNLPASSLSRGLFAEGSSDSQNLRKVARKLFLTALSLTALGAAMVVVLAPFILSIFGQRYVFNSSVVLQIFAVSAVISVPNYFIDIVISINKDNLGYTIVNVGGSLLILISICIGVSFGVNSTAWSWLTGQLLYLLLALIVFRRKRTP
jgi:O-antigen/teichoic acid export membrane protein